MANSTATKPKAEKPKVTEVSASSIQGKRLAEIDKLDDRLIDRLVNARVLEDKADKAKSANMPILIDRATVGLKFGFDHAFSPKVPELEMSKLTYQFWGRWELLQDNVGEAYLVKLGYAVLTEDELADLDSAQKKDRNEKKSNGTRQMRDLAKVIGYSMTLMNAPSELSDSECTAKAFRDARDQVLKDLKTAEGRTEIAKHYHEFCDDQTATLTSKREKLEDAIGKVSKLRADIGLLEKNHDYGTKRPKKTRPDGLVYFKGQRA